jgi:tripartite-type tricarboxylate transporter receptor subunit TctC
MGKRSSITGLGCLVLALLAAGPGRAQDPDLAAAYPSRLVHIIVSAPPGGGPDILARLVGEKLQRRWGQPFVVENHPGAGGNLGAEAVAHAEPDGYTLLAAQPSPLTTGIFFFKHLNFDPAAFEPIAIMTWFPSLLMVRPDFPAAALPELLANAKAHPATLTFASQGIGTTSHLTGELFARTSGTKLVHVPYRGTMPAVNDLVAGHVDMMFLELALASQLYRGHQARALAVATEARLPDLPEIPTLAEGGVDGVRSDSWNALAAPPKTPAAITGKLNAAVNDILHDPAMDAHLRGLMMQPRGGTREDAAEFLRAETRRWGDVIRAAGLAK